MTATVGQGQGGSSRPESNEPAATTAGASGAGSLGAGAPDDGSPGADATFAAENTSWRQRGRGWTRKNKFWLIAGSIFLVVTLTLFVLSNLGQHGTGVLAPDNPAPDGAMAAANVLAGQGVHVDSTDSLAGTLAKVKEYGAASTTVLLYDPETILDQGQLKSLVKEVPQSGGKLVAVTPGPVSVQLMSPDLRLAGAGTFTASTVPGGCANPAASAAGSATTGSLDSEAGTTSLPVQVYRGPVTCFSDPSAPGGSPNGSSGTSGTSGQAGLYAATANASVTVLGNPAWLSNNQLANAGNAALVFGTLGSTQHLIWYIPSLADVPSSESPANLSTLVPAWILPAALWLMFAGVVAMLWRGRRDGPLVVEPLPVIVKASETAAGRARLYQDAKAVDTAAANLRAATLVRLARHLGLGTTTTAAVVAGAAAQHSRMPGTDVHRLLTGAGPSTEKELLAWAQQLSALEEEVTAR